MPPTKESNAKHAFTRTSSNGGLTLSANVYQPATNLLPPWPASPPQSPTGMASSFGNKTTNQPSWSRQNSTNSKYS